ncbi:PTS sugar transporter subunit IIB [Paenibacillus flagellatus]|uniref:PTS ascorbate transporter subunit IIB n=1 Tax=Paenibacillus flagellatus TaxID=2211139 RepID=A0A2V5JXQ6_9BACL|nr:PTS sugar transporter subunit IIB [Paenibacillus flagellatus]PYI51645.1 PTS ascorbate transporter subunit IIB [Paenibacillus flagellatus]
MKLLCVCGLGQGTSLILRMNVETACRDLGIQADVDHMDVSSASGVAADYILTSNELAQSLQGHAARIVVIDNYFDLNEIKTKLNDALR